MKLILDLSLRDLMRDWMQLVCNVAILMGVLAPLLVLFGVKNGVFNALEGRLLSNPATLRIDTAGNNRFTLDDAAEIRRWEGVVFVTPRTRTLFDYVSVRGGPEGRIEEAILEPTGPGDPSLPEGLVLEPGQVVISEALAGKLQAAVGDRLDLVTQAPERPRQLMLPRTIAAILPEESISGRVILADLEALDLVEAFYDEYALPEHGITAGRDIAGRDPVFEGLRVYSATLEGVAPLQARLEEHLGVRTEARTREIAVSLGLGRNLDLALALTAAAAGLGLVATLVFGFWGAVMRRRGMLATLALMGIPRQQVFLFPLIQALVTAAIGLVASFALFGIASLVAASLFGRRMGEGETIVMISAGEVAAITIGVLVLVATAALYAATEAQRADPASVLREVQ